MVGPGFGSTFPDMKRRRNTQSRGKMKSQDAKVSHVHEVEEHLLSLDSQDRGRRQRFQAPTLALHCDRSIIINSLSLNKSIILTLIYALISMNNYDIMKAVPPRLSYLIS